MANDKEVLDSRMGAIAECRQFLADLHALALAAEQAGKEDGRGSRRPPEERDGDGQRD